MNKMKVARKGGRIRVQDLLFSSVKVCLWAPIQYPTHCQSVLGKMEFACGVMI
jgi:hypothetical protein